MTNQWQSALSDFGKNAKVLTTEARRTHAVMVDYWNKNSVKDLELRKELGLTKSDSLRNSTQRSQRKT